MIVFPTKNVLDVFSNCYYSATDLLYRKSFHKILEQLKPVSEKHILWLAVDILEEFINCGENTDLTSVLRAEYKSTITNIKIYLSVMENRKSDVHKQTFTWLRRYRAEHRTNPMPIYYRVDSQVQIIRESFSLLTEALLFCERNKDDLYRRNSAIVIWLITNRFDNYNRNSTPYYARQNSRFLLNVYLTYFNPLLTVDQQTTLRNLVLAKTPTSITIDFFIDNGLLIDPGELTKHFANYTNRFLEKASGLY